MGDDSDDDESDLRNQVDKQRSQTVRSIRTRVKLTYIPMGVRRMSCVATSGDPQRKDMGVVPWGWDHRDGVNIHGTQEWELEVVRVISGASEDTSEEY